jgi:hypothetical protein
MPLGFIIASADIIHTPLFHYFDIIYAGDITPKIRH